ncbi:hypothetical protein DFJ73DRAFT_789978 [Zopfochytrium polystomum]|nr:hypothetical protein DFJ73DRAFT_789978 [Zopfochytrium polystomum]
MAAPDLRLISERLAQPPFNRSLSVIQIHDELAIPAIVQLITDVASHIDEGASVPSVHKVDIRNEEPEDTAWRLGDLLRILKYRGAVDMPELRQQIQDGDRTLLLDILGFLLKDIPTHRKRCYLAVYLEGVDVPPEYMQDDGTRGKAIWLLLNSSCEMIVTRDLADQVGIYQEQFKEVHKYVDSVRQTGGLTANLKKEIQQMEEEKQQVLSKINKIRKKIEQVPNHETWLQAAKSLRLEQQTEATVIERIREQRNLIATAEKKLSTAQQTLKDARTSLATAGPDALFAKMEEECKMNKYLATENLPKAIEDAKLKVRDLNKVILEPPLSESDFQRIEAEIKALNEETAKLAEKRLLKNNSGDDKLALFRQQAAIIARKKEGTAQRLSAITEEVARLSDELDKKRELAKGSSSGIKILKGDDFKRYVSELRGKSNVYKRKKAALSELMTEFGILQRTEEILRSREQAMSSTLRELEARGGVLGYHSDREALEKVSERKSEMDEEKGKALNEISEIIQKLVTTINDKKGLLAPIIQELRTLRTVAGDMETEYLAKKKQYDATMVGIDSEAIQLEQEVKGYRQDINNDQSRYHYLSMMIGLTDIILLSARISLRKVLQEMKAYIGGDDLVEMQQKARGFKTYRDAYNKKTAEQEIWVVCSAKHEPNIKQLAMFNDVKRLLQLKLEHNKKVLRGEGTDSGFEGTMMTQDRLVL